MNVKRGDIVAWRGEPHIALKVISDPFPYAGGGDTVVAQRVAKKKSDRQQGLYRVSALVPCVKEMDK